MDKHEKYAFGDRVSDKIAKFGGSWSAIFACSSVIIVWIILNTWVFATPIDPFPYILLNLALSCIAALQAPFILMASARQEIKDRARSQEDLDIDKKAEREVREVLAKLKTLERKIDSLASQLKG
jgi:uncharacterized membrane protein